MTTRQFERQDFTFRQYVRAATTFFSTVGTALLLENLKFSYFFAAAQSYGNPQEGLYTGTGVANKVAFVGTYPLGQLSTAGLAYDVCVRNNLAYVAVGSAGLQIIDVTNQASPLLVGSYNTTGFARQVDLAGNYALVAADTAGLVILDVTTPSSIKFTSSYLLSQPVTRAVVANNLAFIANNNEAVFDVVTIGPKPVSVIGTNYTIGRSITDFYAVNNTVFINHLGLGMTVADATTLPKITAFTTLANAKAITTLGNFAYVAADTAGLQILDITQANNPQPVGSFSIPGGNALGIFIDMTHVYVAAGSAGLYIIDVNTPASPQLLSNFTTPGIAKNVFVLANLAYVSADTAGVVLLDITNPKSPVFQTVYNTQGHAEAVYAIILNTQIATALYDQLAYVADGEQGLQVLYVKNTVPPASFQYFGNYTGTGYTYGVFQQNSLVCIAANDQGLGIIDVSDPNNPRLFGSYATLNATDVAMFGNTVYMTDKTQGLYVFDISSVSYPKLLGIFETPGTALRFSYTGSRVYVADNSAGLQIIDAPFWESRLPKPTTVIQIAGNNNYAYVSTVEKILNIVGIGVNSTLGIVSTYNLQSSVRDIEVAPAYVYLTEGPMGIEIVDVNDPTNPRLATQYNSSLTNARGFQVYNNTLFIADDVAGLKILGLDVQPLITENQMIIYQGQTKLVTFDNLDAYDPDTLPTQIVFTVTSVVGGYFQLTTNPGVAITTFTLNNRFQNQLQFVQDGSNTAPNYMLKVSDGTLTDGPYSPIVIFNQPPVWIANQLIISQGQSLQMTPAMLDASVAPNISISYDYSSVQFTVTSIQNGQFQNLLLPGVAITNFTKMDIANRNILFITSGQSVAPSYSLTVTNGAFTIGPLAAIVNFTRINQVPKFYHNTIMVNEGQTTIISLAQLQAISDNNNNTLQFSVSVMGNGLFQVPRVIVGSTVVDANITIGAQFSQQNIMDGFVAFRSTGGAVPFYTFAVTDSTTQLQTAFINGSVDFDFAPVLMANQLSVSRGQTVSITSADLLAIDADDNNATLLFQIYNLSYGTFLQVNQSMSQQPQKVSQFPQWAVTGGQIEFVHDGSPNAPSYLVSVQDRRMTIPNVTAKITFTDPTQQVAQNTASIAGPVVGGIAAAALLATGGFFVRSYLVDRQTRKPYGFADDIYQALKLNEVKNFKSANGKRFVAAVGQLMAAFKKYNIDVPNMPRSQQQALAQDVATEAKNKITSSTSCLGYSEITMDDLEQKIDVIAAAVAQNRGAGDTATYSQIGSRY